MGLKISWSGIYYGVTDLRSKVQLKITCNGLRTECKICPWKERLLLDFSSCKGKESYEAQLEAIWLIVRWTEGRAQDK